MTTTYRVLEEKAEEIRMLEDRIAKLAAQNYKLKIQNQKLAAALQDAANIQALNLRDMQDSSEAMTMLINSMREYMA